MNAKKDSNWTVFSDYTLTTLNFDGALLVYHQGTGETHYLAGMVGKVFELFLQNNIPLKLDRITDELKAWGIVDYDPDLLTGMLDSLHIRYLLERLD